MGDVTSSSTDSEDAMIPAANTELDSGVQAFSRDAGVSLSSPPPSQSIPSQNDGSTEAMDLIQGNPTRKSANGRDTGEKYYPGASWNNKKARDEWQRAWSQIEYKNFSLSKHTIDDLVPLSD